MKCSQLKIKWTPEQLKIGVVSPESNGRQKEIQVFIENRFKQDEIQWLQRGQANLLCMWIETRPIFIAKERNQLRRLLHDTGVWKEGEQLITTGTPLWLMTIRIFTTEDINDTLEVLDVVPLKKKSSFLLRLLCTG
jgi:hypothetical protein